MLILKKIVIKAFWFLINIFLVPTGYFYLLTITKPLKLKKIRVFNFLQLDDGNLNFIAIHDGNHVFVKIDFFGRNLENELKAYKYLENHELSFSLPRIVFFKKNILITDFIMGSQTIDSFLKQNPNKYNWVVNKISRILNDFRRIKFSHNDFLLQNILIFKDCIFIIDLYYSKYPGSKALFNQNKKIAYNYTNSTEGDKKTFFEDLQTYSLNLKNKVYKFSEIISVIVVYDPNLVNLKYLLSLHSTSFSSSVVVNNSPEINLGDLPMNIHVITCNTSISQASALNLGISYAKKKGFKMCAFFDQDTTFRDSFVKDTIKRINLYKAKKKDALFSPIFFNNVTNSYCYNFIYKFFLLVRSKPNPTKTILNSDYLIASGSFIPIEAIDEGGLI